MTSDTNDELAARITADLNEVEARMEAGGVPARVQRRFKAGHALMADAAADLIGAGHIQPFSGGEPKTP